MKKRAMKKSAASYKSKRGALRAVFAGKISSSKGGLKASALMKTKSGAIRCRTDFRNFLAAVGIRISSCGRQTH